MGVRLLGDPHGSNSHGTCSNISHAYMRAFKTEAPHIGHCRNSPKYGPCYQRRELRLAERSVWAHMEVNICGNVKQPAETLNPSASKLGQHQKGRTHIHHASTKQLLSGRVLRTARFGASGRLQEPVRIVVPVRTYSHNRCLLMPLVLSVGWTWRGVVWCGVRGLGQSAFLALATQRAPPIALRRSSSSGTMADVSPGGQAGNSAQQPQV